VDLITIGSKKKIITGRILCKDLLTIIASSDERADLDFWGESSVVCMLISEALEVFCVE